MTGRGVNVLCLDKTGTITVMDVHLISICIPFALLSVFMVFLFTKIVDRIFEDKDIRINIKEREKMSHRAFNCKNQQISEISVDKIDLCWYNIKAVR